MSQFLKPLELSEPKSISITTSSTAGEPTPVSISGSVFELIVINRSADYDAYVSFDFGATWVRVPADCAAPFLLGSLADPLLLVKSDGSSQKIDIVYRVRT